MVPRSRIVAISRTADENVIKQVALEHGFSRFPVYGKDLDDIVGYVLVKDMLAIAWERQLVVLEDLDPPSVGSERDVSRARGVEADAGRARASRGRRRRARRDRRHRHDGGSRSRSSWARSRVSSPAPAPRSVRLQSDGSALARGDATLCAR